MIKPNRSKRKIIRESRLAKSGSSFEMCSITYHIGGIRSISGYDEAKLLIGYFSSAASGNVIYSHK